jgi:selenide,water dikinase
MCEGSDVKAKVNFDAIPFLAPVKDYLELGCVPGGTLRNYDSYGDKLAPMTEEQRNLLCDPQTSGGLLIAVEPESEAELAALLSREGLYAEPIGELLAPQEGTMTRVEVV